MANLRRRAKVMPQFSSDIIPTASKDHPKEHIVERALRFKGGKPNTDGNSNDADQFHEIRIQNEEKKEEKKKGTEV